MHSINKNKLAGKIFALAVCLFFSAFLFAQQGFKTRIDPQNPKRKIIDLPPVIRKAPVIDEKRNVLDDASFKRAPIPFKPFEMRNPKTGKDLDPNAVLTIAMPDKTTRTTTVKQFYEQLNKMESALAARGRSLRDPASFTDLRPKFVSNNYKNPPALPKGFQAGIFKVNPVVNKFSNNNIITKPSTNIIIKPVTNPPVLFNIVNWDAETYIAGYTENTGTTEFPAEWMKASGTGKGRNIYPVIVQVPKGIEGLIDRIEWQVTTTPFDGTLKDVDVPGIIQKGFLGNIQWSTGFRGTGELPAYKKSTYCIFYVDLAKAQQPEPVDDVKPYYVRAVCFNKAGDVVKISSQAVANYGAKEVAMTMPLTETQSVPKFSYQFPEEGSSIPFGVFIKGKGFNSANFKEITTKGGNSSINKLGYSISSNASLGIKYFNFLSLVSDNEPASKPFTLINADFNAVLGKVKNNSGSYLPYGIKLNLSFLDGAVPYNIDFTNTVPGSPNLVQLDYSLPQSIDIGLLDMRFFIGPVPIKIAASIKGEAGIKMFGQANTSSFEISGGIEPYVKTSFDASGGVDAIIAYATLNAQVDPLLALNMPMTFNSSNGSPLNLNSTLSGLAGRVFLKVGFYYPCPSLEKIIGFLSGSEPLPLCECSWEYNIFDFPGFTHTYSY